jgi:hypothetical protein
MNKSLLLFSFLWLFFLAKPASASDFTFSTSSRQPYDEGSVYFLHDVKYKGHDILAQSPEDAVKNNEAWLAFGKVIQHSAKHFDDEAIQRADEAIKAGPTQDKTFDALCKSLGFSKALGGLGHPLDLQNTTTLASPSDGQIALRKITPAIASELKLSAINSLCCYKNP